MSKLSAAQARVLGQIRTAFAGADAFEVKRWGKHLTGICDVWPVTTVNVLVRLGYVVVVKVADHQFSETRRNCGPRMGWSKGWHLNRISYTTRIIRPTEKKEE